MLIIFPTIRNGFDINCVKLWVFFCKFCMLSIKFNYTAPSSILKLLESCFHPSARSFDFLTSFFVSCLCLRVFNILSICPRDVFNPARNNVRFFFCDCFHCCPLITHSVFYSVSDRRCFYPHYCHGQSHCVHLQALQSCR